MLIRYARLFNLGNYENERIEVEEEVQPGEKPADTVRRLAAFVAAQGEQLREDRRRAVEESRRRAEDIPF